MSSKKAGFAQRISLVLGGLIVITIVSVWV
jgi:hypothetical protein